MLAYVTCAEARRHDADLPLLEPLLPELVVVDWHDDTVEWSEFAAAIVRSTWDYTADRDGFLAWAERVDRLTDLWNPLDTIAWNTDKRYLLDLAAHGVPVVPTDVVAPGERADGIVDLGAADGVVVKPSVGAGSRGVRHVRGATAALEAIEHLHRSDRTALIQPYLPEIDVVGETGLVYVSGRFSHAFSKAAILSKPIEFEDGSLTARESVVAHQPTPAERALADEVVRDIGHLAYARVDVLPSTEGPVLLELELTEPSLFLDVRPDRAEHVAAAFRSLAG